MWFLGGFVASLGSSLVKGIQLAYDGVENVDIHHTGCGAMRGQWWMEKEL